MKKWVFLVLATGLLALPACAPAAGEPLVAPIRDARATVDLPPTPLVTSSPAPPDGRSTTTGPGPTATPSGDQVGLPEETPTAIQSATPAASTPSHAETVTATIPPPSAAPLPVETVPAAPSPTAVVASIDVFRASVEEADPGDTITLEWATKNAVTVTLWRLMPTGQFGQFWDVEEAGVFEYQIDEFERNLTRFALSVTDDAGQTQMATVEITLRCPDAWFLTNPPAICPSRAALVSAGAEQYFQGGLMLWSEAENRLYILYGDGQSPQWSAFADEWDPGEPELDPELEPPPGLYQPTRGFGKVWREQPGVRERLGWALAEEVGYQTAVQRTSYAKYNETYIQAADGGVWRLRPEHSGWEKR